jgi:hypothetical protein
MVPWWIQEYVLHLVRFIITTSKGLSYFCNIKLYWITFTNVYFFSVSFIKFWCTQSFVRWWSFLELFKHWEISRIFKWAICSTCLFLNNKRRYLILHGLSNIQWTSLCVRKILAFFLFGFRLMIKLGGIYWDLAIPDIIQLSLKSFLYNYFCNDGYMALSRFHCLLIKYYIHDAWKTNNTYYLQTQVSGPIMQQWKSVLCWGADFSVCLCLGCL